MADRKTPAAPGGTGRDRRPPAPQPPPLPNTWAGWMRWLRQDHDNPWLAALFPSPRNGPGEPRRGNVLFAGVDWVLCIAFWVTLIACPFVRRLLLDE